MFGNFYWFYRGEALTSLAYKIHYLSMLKILVWIEYIVSALIIASVLLQHRGAGLGGAFASSGNAYRSKRGIEKFLFNATIASAVVLVVVALTHLYLRLKGIN